MQQHRPERHIALEPGTDTTPELDSLVSSLDEAERLVFFLELGERSGGSPLAFECFFPDCDVRDIKRPPAPEWALLVLLHHLQ